MAAPRARGGARRSMGAGGRGAQAGAVLGGLLAGRLGMDGGAAGIASCGLVLGRGGRREPGALSRRHGAMVRDGQSALTTSQGPTPGQSTTIESAVPSANRKS
jgi:hypothetical protein